MKNKKYFTFAGISALLTALLIIGLRTIDIAAIGPEGTRVGFSHLNKAVFDSTGFNELWYKITTVLGIVTILTAVAFIAIGGIQLITRRSLKKIDRTVLLLGGLYVITFALYVLFDVIVVNYRPVIMPDAVAPEASFPSTHTMLVCVIMGSAMMVIDQYIKNGGLCNALRIVFGLIILITVIGRLLSSVHWFTDIIGGLLFSLTLLFLFAGIKEGK